MPANDPEKGLPLNDNTSKQPERPGAEPGNDSNPHELAESDDGSNHAAVRKAGGAADTYALAQTSSISRFDSRYTEASEAASEVVDIQESNKKRKWSERMNPFKRKIKPPVPKERVVSREHNAGFFSLLTFHWMAPLMKVRLLLERAFYSG